MLEEKLPSGRFAVELPSLMARTIKSNIGLDIIGHQSGEKRRQQAHAIINNACCHLLGVEGRSLLAQINVTRNFPHGFDNGQICNFMRIGYSPKWCPKPD